MHSGERHAITTDGFAPGGALVRRYRDVVAAYAVHPEGKSLAPDGLPSGRRTVGLLARRPVEAARVAYIGKESNRLEDVEAGMVHNLGEVLTEYRDPDRDDWTEVVLPVLREMPKAELARATGIHPRTVAAARNGHQMPRLRTAALLVRAGAAFVRLRLRSSRIRPPVDDLAACRAYLEHRQAGFGEDAIGHGSEVLEE